MKEKVLLLAPPSLPREHGAWVMLLTPLVLGLAQAGRLAAASLSIVAGMLLLFVARSTSVPAAARLLEGRPPPKDILLRRLLWTGVYTLTGVAFFAAALLQMEAEMRPVLLRPAAVTMGLGLVHTAVGLAGRDRTVAAELLGMAGLASAAPLVIAASGRPLDGRAIGVAALAFGYFASSLVFVRSFRRQRESGRVDARGCLWAHAVIAVLLVAIWVIGWIPLGGLLAFLPVAWRTVWGLRYPPRNLRILGWREVGVATAFNVVAAVALLR